jgi:anthranilate phosphoribosyltransferase
MLENNFLEKLLKGEHLTIDEADGLLNAIASNQINEMMAAGILIALRMKGEHANEVAGFSKAMRSLSVNPEIKAQGKTIDIVGTGGDGSKSLNLSTGSALLAAACGLKVIKHGNRSISSSCGSADVLEKIGFPINQAPSKNQPVLNAIGFTFLYAPNYHPAMKSIAPIRKSLATRTIFNILGPLVNPYNVSHLMIGAFSSPVAELMADSIQALPIQKAAIVHSENGWDEATPICPFELIMVSPGESNIKEIIDPKELGLEPCSANDLAGSDPTDNCERLKNALNNKDSLHHRNALCLGAGIALHLSGKVTTIKMGIDMAKSVLASGKAKTLVDQVRELDHV